MAEKNKDKKINIYEVASKAGKRMKKFGGYALAIGVVLVATRRTDLIKKLKK